MSWGDPTKMSDKERSDGHAGTVAKMPEHHRKLCEASGRVSDHRRLVAFIYLLLRDVFPAGRMGEVMLKWSDTSHVPLGEMEAALLVDKLSDAPRAPIARWLATVYEFGHGLRGMIDDRMAMLPAQDDTETVFTNGWLAHYAKHLADTLENDAC